MSVSPPDIADGVHFQLDAEVYHQIPALSATGIKNLLISGPDFWYRTPWLNPDCVDEDTEARFIGRAYHKRILEGRDAFYEDYAQSFDAPADCIRTVDDLKDALIKCGVEKPKGLKPDLIEQLLELQPNAKILDELRADYEVLHHGKEFLSADLIHKIEISAAMIEKNPHIAKCFTGGYPEVTVIWTENDIRFKARFDYLKPKSVIDLKTFANFLNKPIESAIYSAMANGKYHIQACHYLKAVAAAKAAAKPTDFPGADEWLREFTDCDDHAFWFVFQAKGIAPLARLLRFDRTSLWSCGEVAIEQAVERFRYFMAKYGDELPWVDDTEPKVFDDSLFPVWATEL